MDKIYIPPIESCFKRLKWLVSKKGYSEDEDAYNGLVRHFNKMLEDIPVKYGIIESLIAHEFLRQAKGIDEVKSINPPKRNPRDIMNYVSRVSQKTEDDWVEIYMREIPLIRFELLYQDYEKGLRKAREIAEKNSISPEDSDLLMKEYQASDLDLVAEAHRKRADDMLLDCERVVTKPYTEDEARYFLRSQTNKIIKGI